MFEEIPGKPYGAANVLRADDERLPLIKEIITAVTGRPAEQTGDTVGVADQIPVQSAILAYSSLSWGSSSSAKASIIQSAFSERVMRYGLAGYSSCSMFLILASYLR